MFPYGDQIEDVDDFYPALIDVLHDRRHALLPAEGFLNLALVINTGGVEAAGLTDEDIPTTWDELATVSRRSRPATRPALSTPARPIGSARSWSRPAAGSPTRTRRRRRRSPGERGGVDLPAGEPRGRQLQDSADVEAGWGGEAFGTGKAAMTVEGPWIVGALDADWPDVQWQAAELPEGPPARAR